MGIRGRYHPWRDLAGRAHIDLAWAALPAAVGNGLIIDHPDRPGRRVVILDDTALRAERRAALTHELIHDERGVMPRDTPPLLRAKEEAIVRRHTARRLVPPDLLTAWLHRQADPVTIHDIADAFDVPPHVAQAAVRLVI